MFENNNKVKIKVNIKEKKLNIHIIQYLFFKNISRAIFKYFTFNFIFLFLNKKERIQYY